MTSNQKHYIADSIIRDINRGEYFELIESFFITEVIDILQARIGEFNDLKLMEFDNSTIINSKIVTNIIGRKINKNKELKNKLRELWTFSPTVSLAFQILNDQEIEMETILAVNDFVFNNFGIFKLEENNFENFTGQSIDNFFLKIKARTNKAGTNKKWIYVYSLAAHPACKAAHLEKLLTEAQINNLPLPLELFLDRIASLLNK